MTIINNNAVSSVELLRVDNPFCDYVYPDSKKPISNGYVYFGQAGQDPTQPENQKPVYAIQENGSYVLAEQPVRLGQGGVPMYDNQPTVLATDGDYSLAVHDSHGAQVYNRARVVNRSFQDVGNPSVIQEKATYLSGLLFEFESIDLRDAQILHKTGSQSGFRVLVRDVDYTIVSGSTNRLSVNFAVVGPTDIIYGRQNVFTSQGLSTYPTANYFPTVALAQQADLDLGDIATIGGESAEGDGLIYRQYRVIPFLGDAGYPATVQMDNGLTLKALPEKGFLQSYSETPVSVTPSASNVLTIDLSLGTVFTTTLSQPITSFAIINAIGQVGANPAKANSFTLYIKQDGTGGNNVNFTGFKASGGTSPTITTTADAEDVVTFTTYNGGADWYVFQSGEDMQTI